jgi:hypothetical protein
VRAGDRLELLDAVKLALKRLVLLEGAAAYDLHRAQGAEDIARQPHFAVAAAPDAAEQFVIGNEWRWNGVVK